MRVLARKCFILFVTLAISLLALEAAVRLSGRAKHLYTDPAFEQPAGLPYWRYRPGFEGALLGPTATRIGPLGSRLHRSSATKAEPVMRVAVFGDSITFGQAVEAELSYAGRLEQALAETGLSVEVLNFGVQGHTLEMILAHLEDRAPELRPACLVLSFISDDLRGARAENHVDSFGYLTKNLFGAPSPWMDLVRALLRKSHLALLTKDSILRIRERRQGDAAEKESTPEQATDDTIGRFREAMARFRAMPIEAGKIVFCLDFVETDLTLRLQALMRSQFPDLPYVHAPPALVGMSQADIKVPRDGHPNATVHQIYARLLAPVVSGTLRTRGAAVLP